MPHPPPSSRQDDRPKKAGEVDHHPCVGLPALAHVEQEQGEAHAKEDVDRQSDQVDQAVPQGLPEGFSGEHFYIVCKAHELRPHKVSAEERELKDPGQGDQRKDDENRQGRG